MVDKYLNNIISIIFYTCNDILIIIFYTYKVGTFNTNEYLILIKPLSVDK